MSNQNSGQISNQNANKIRKSKPANSYVCNGTKINTEPESKQEPKLRLRS